MPKFLDHHAISVMSAEQKMAMTAQLKSMIESRKPDANGVILLNVFMGDGQSWGYNEAPDADAVVKQHEAMGLKIKASDVVEVTSIV